MAASAISSVLPSIADGAMQRPVQRMENGILPLTAPALAAFTHAYSADNFDGPSGIQPAPTSNSEHGHAITRIQPMTRHSAESVSAWFNGFFTTIIGISTLGASITFSYLLSSPTAPRSGSVFSVDHVQGFLGVSWLLFLLALAFGSLSSTVLTFFKDHWKKDWEGEHGKTSQRDVQLYATFATGLLGGLMVSAFVFLCLVVVAYSPVIGWLALGFTAAFGLVVVLGVAIQAPWPWQNNQPDINKKAWWRR